MKETNTPLSWSKGEKSLDPVLNPAADFRINGMGRVIARDFDAKEDDIWWLILVELDGDGDDRRNYSLREIFKLAAGLGIGDDPNEFLAVPPEYSEAFREETPPGPLTLYARRAYIEAANTQSKKAGIKWLEVGPALRKGEFELRREPLEAPGKAGKILVPKDAVVMAVVDSGIAVGHELFRAEGATPPGSRVAYFWNIDGAPIPPGSVPAGATEPVGTGNAWTQQGLTQQLRANTHAGLLDDPAFYKAIGAMDWATRRHTPIAQRVSHGTHVMGLAAGYPTALGSNKNKADTRPIIAVNLRATDVRDPSGSQLVWWLHLAFLYILDRYRRFEIEGSPGERPPLVVNFSFGNFAGPHDGTSLIERVIANGLQMLRAENPNCQIVLPAGNGNQSRCYARVELTEETPSVTLPWRVQPGDQSASGLQIWKDDGGGGQDVRLSIDGPGNLNPVSLDSTGLFDFATLRGAGNELLGYAYYLSPLLTPYTRGFFAVELFATFLPDDLDPFVPSGLWQLELSALARDPKAGLHVWIERDETLPGFSEFGRQSYFDDPAYARFYEPGVNADALDERLIGGPLCYDPIGTTSPVLREGTISGFAGVDDAILIGGFFEKPWPKLAPMALYSSTGFTLNGKAVHPTAAARSDDSQVMRGVMSAGSASGSFVAMDGTSVATPRVARLVANILSAGGNGSPAGVAQEAGQQDPSGGGNVQKPPPNKAGGGRLLDLKQLFGQLR